MERADHRWWRRLHQRLPERSTGMAWNPVHLSAVYPAFQREDLAATDAGRGWSISVDGVYGPGSRNACLAFQREKGLAADGIVGPATWQAAWVAAVT
ncbi:peptidoglycan-binding protein [Streptomyces sp. AC602_WCS936]|uniref:peptidoglycan-binding domain-containing protein n=1 Tax=Streptomyces sp. AC602_WCS936 TaxID=2823685 RepID=UPI0035B251CD